MTAQGGPPGSYGQPPYGPQGYGPQQQGPPGYGQGSYVATQEPRGRGRGAAFAVIGTALLGLLVLGVVYLLSQDDGDDEVAAALPAEPAGTEYAYERYTHQQAGFSFEHPQGWQTREIGDDVYFTAEVAPNLALRDDDVEFDTAYLAVSVPRQSQGVYTEELFRRDFTTSPSCTTVVSQAALTRGPYEGFLLRESGCTGTGTTIPDAQAWSVVLNDPTTDTLALIVRASLSGADQRDENALLNVVDTFMAGAAPAGAAPAPPAATGAAPAPTSAAPQEAPQVSIVAGDPVFAFYSGLTPGATVDYACEQLDPGGTVQPVGSGSFTVPPNGEGDVTLCSPVDYGQPTDVQVFLTGGRADVDQTITYP